MLSPCSSPGREKQPVVISNVRGTDAAPPSYHAVLSANQILKLLPRAALDLLGLESVELRRGQCLFEPGDEVIHAYLPLDSAVIALVVPMRDGRTVEAATVGREGAVGGIV